MSHVHVWTNHVHISYRWVPVQKSCHTYRWVMTHVWMSHVWMSHVYVTPHIWMSHVYICHRRVSAQRGFCCCFSWQWQRARSHGLPTGILGLCCSMLQMCCGLLQGEESCAIDRYIGTVFAVYCKCVAGLCRARSHGPPTGTLGLCCSMWQVCCRVLQGKELWAADRYIGMWYRVLQCFAVRCSALQCWNRHRCIFPIPREPGCKLYINSAYLRVCARFSTIDTNWPLSNRSAIFEHLAWKETCTSDQYKWKETNKRDLLTLVQTAAALWPLHMKQRPIWETYSQEKRPRKESHTLSFTLQPCSSLNLWKLCTHVCVFGVCVSVWPIWET